MTDIQLLSIVVAVVLPVSMLIYSNSRITEVKDTLRAEMALGFERLANQITRLEASLKLHEIEHHQK